MSREPEKIVYDGTLLFRMREITPEQMDEGIEKFYKARSGMTVIMEVRHREHFEVSVIHSGTSVYEVARFGFFFICNCPDFRHKRTACKHLFLVYPRVCWKCHETPMNSLGQFCEGCKRKKEHEAQDTSPYLSVRKNKPIETVGGIRI
jgi:hypothetical protein